MPFLTEELWHSISERTPEQALIINHWPEIAPVDKQLIKNFNFATEVVSGIRTIRKEKNIAFKDAISLSIINTEKQSTQLDSVITKLGNISNLNYIESPLEGALTFRVKSNEYFIPMEGAIDVQAEIKKLTEELAYTKGFLRKVQGKLRNEKFVNGAPAQVVANERKKEADTLAKMETIKTSLLNLK